MTMYLLKMHISIIRLTHPYTQTVESNTSKGGCCVRGNNGVVTHEGLCFVADVQVGESPKHSAGFPLASGNPAD